MSIEPEQESKSAPSFSANVSAESTQPSFIRFCAVNYQTKKQTLLHDLSFELQIGGITALVGLNGAGKSTLLSLATGEQSPTAGEVTIGNCSPCDNNVKQKLGYQSSTMLALPALTVKEYLNLVFELKAFDEQLFSSSLSKVVEQWNLESILDKLLSRLSQGNLQKVMIAQAFIGDPDYLFLDEPSQALDPVEQQRLNKNLSLLSATQSCLFTSHHVSEIVANASRVILLDRGRLIALLNLTNENEFWILLDTNDANSIEKQEPLIDAEIVFRSESKCLVRINQCHGQGEVDNMLRNIGKSFSSIKFLGNSKEALMPLFNLLANQEF